MAQASGDAEANDPARDTTQARPATQDQLKPSPEVQTVTVTPGGIVTISGTPISLGIPPLRPRLLLVVASSCLEV